MKRKRTGVLIALLSHLVLVLAAMMLTLFILDRFNEAMAFLNNDITKWLLACFALAAGVLAAACIVRYEKERRRERSLRVNGPKGEKDEQE